MDLALLLLRLAVGGAVAAHGARNLLGRFGGPGRRATAARLGSLGYHPGGWWAGVVGGVQLGGGLALVVGLLTPVAAVPVAGVLLAAVAVVHWERGFFASEGGVELPLVLAAVAVALASAGAGRWSLDHALGWSLGGAPWGVVAGVLAVAAAGVATAVPGLRLFRPGGATTG